jgi:hypothetical protein
MIAGIPSFAVVGAVNHGKSSVVSTLAEDDRVRISAMPGETVECAAYSLRDLFVCHDTPGFQNAFEALAELRPAAQAREPLAVFRAFVEKHRGESEFDAECRLFAPLIEGAGVVYVVDGSRPWTELHGAEMEILRLTGQPRLAIINRTSATDHVADWKRRLGLHFNAVREFNAHAASFADRIELLETLAAIEHAWKPKLSSAVKLLREEWEARLDECAEILAELLIDALQYRESEAPKSDLPEARKRQAEALRTRFLSGLGQREARAHREIIRLFGHRLVKAEGTEMPAITGDLFGDETWRLAGLNEKQLVAAGAILGGATGASLDILTAGHTLLAGTLAGSAVGAGVAWFTGKQRPEVKVRVPGLGARLHLGGVEMTAGPLTALNFPWILLDRAIGTLAYVANRAHARRDEVALDAQRLLAVLEEQRIATKDWPDEIRRACEKLFVEIRRHRLKPEQRVELKRHLRTQLARLCERRIDFDRR